MSTSAVIANTVRGRRSEVADMVAGDYDSEALRAAMYDLGLTTYQLADEAGLPHLRVREIILGECRCSVFALERLCDVLDLEMDDILTKELAEV